jgi:prophage DNA circulation protein
MSQISDIQNPWRNLLKQPASFRGVAFHVESGSRASGRRTVTHEYPKRNDPYAEDMGRHAIRFAFSGYLIYRVNPPPGFSPYVQQRTQLLIALEKDDIGKLYHPVLAPSGMDVMCERYSMVESRERGGFTQFEMQFVQSGTPGNSIIVTDTNGNVMNKASAAETTSLNALAKAQDDLMRRNDNLATP